MEYKKDDDDDYEMGVGKPEGYYRIGKNLKKDYDSKKKSIGECHIMKDGNKMMGKKHKGPDGYWGI